MNDMKLKEVQAVAKITPRAPIKEDDEYNIKHKGQTQCNHCGATSIVKIGSRKEECDHCDGKGYLDEKDWKRLKKNRMKNETNAPSGNMKLVPLIPEDKLTELGFHGGNPQPDDVDVLMDDFDEEYNEAENALDNVLDGVINAAHEAEFSDVESQIRQQVTLLRKAIGSFRVNVQKIYSAKRKKLGGK